MFERLKNALTGSFAVETARSHADPVSEWAGMQGLAYTGSGDGKGFSLKGQIAGRPWRLERGKASRQYIEGEEVRARAELAIHEEISVLIMNRPLKEVLEKRTYQMYTDSLQTTADPNLPEELRWLAMYPEVGWSGLSDAFWVRYAVMADQREHAVAWITPALAHLMLSWPEPGPAPEVPFILMIMRGKLYLRMQYTPADMPTLEHASTVFTSACEAAIAGFSTDIPL